LTQLGTIPQIEGVFDINSVVGLVPVPAALLVITLPEVPVVLERPAMA
jgi:hypothetical protein